MYVSKVQTRPKSGCCAPVPSVDKVLYNVWLDSLNDSILAAYMLCPRGCTNKWSFLLAGLQLTLRSDGRWWTCIAILHHCQLPIACRGMGSTASTVDCTSSWRVWFVPCHAGRTGRFPGGRHIGIWCHSLTTRLMRVFSTTKKHLEKSADKVILFISPTPSPTISYLISYLASILSFTL